MPREPAPPAAAHALRAFNRFYTRRMGVLGTGTETGPGEKASADSGPQPATGGFSLTESRVLWELAQRPGLTARALTLELGLDAGYLSRLLARLQQRGLVQVQRLPHDARQKPLALTAAGRRAYTALDRRAQKRVLDLLAPLAPQQQNELLFAAQRMQHLLSPASAPTPATLRGLQAGDLGWVISRHGALYAAEYGWDQRFEALVARIAADYVQQLNPALEAAWVAECNGHAMGCVFLVQARAAASAKNPGKPMPGVAQLRLLLVEPTARGQGLGKLLVQACQHFAAQAGYRKLRLWTHSNLLAARSIYRAAGYRLLYSEPHHSFGADLVGEVWERDLRGVRAPDQDPPAT